MSEQHRILTVILDRDYSNEPLEAIEDALRMVKGVAGVERAGGADVDALMQREIAKDQIRRELGEALMPSWLRKKKEGDR